MSDSGRQKVVEFLNQGLTDASQVIFYSRRYPILKSAVNQALAELETAVPATKVEQQPEPWKFRQKVTCALLDCRTDEQQRKVALKLLHEAEDIIDPLHSTSKTPCGEVAEFTKEVRSWCVELSSVRGVTMLEACDKLDRLAEENRELSKSWDYHFRRGQELEEENRVLKETVVYKDEIIDGLNKRLSDISAQC